MSTAPEILAEFRSAIGALNSTRKGTPFLPHPDAAAFGEVPIAAGDSFAVMMDSQRTTGAFGRSGTKQDEIHVLVMLGHGPYVQEIKREEFVNRDVERIRDVLEMRAWTATVEACFFEEAPINRTNKEWWVTAMAFRVQYTGSIATS